jgi:hypothetical protein
MLGDLLSRVGAVGKGDRLGDKSISQFSVVDMINQATR